MKKGILLLIISFILTAPVLSHPWKPNHFVIIDTDGGIDDFRAISMLLASPDIRVLGITVTTGVLPAREVFNKVQALLKLYSHEGIPVGINETDIKPANFEAAKSFSWGNVVTETNQVRADDVVKYIYKNSPDSVHFICLGSLNIIHQMADKVDGFRNKTAEIIWSCENYKKDECFNNSLDKEAFKRVARLKIPVFMVDGKSVRAGAFQQGFSESLNNLPVGYSQEINRSLSPGHKIFYDEIIPLWMHFPQYFSRTEFENFPLMSLNSSVSEKEIEDACVRIIAGETVNQNQVINFSWRKEDYFPDVQPIMDETIKKYGKAEWIAETMANELHRHLGVFAIVGTKMGIRAKEYFNAGIDEMKILSYAGTIPPFSCMNDGLQVSTGATVGHGLIAVSTDTIVRPVADFTYMGRTIKVSLKPEFAKKIASEVKELNKIHGLNSDIYWELIRKLAIK